MCGIGAQCSTASSRGTGRAQSGLLGFPYQEGNGRGGCLEKAAVRSKWQRTGACADCGRNVGAYSGENRHL